MRWFWRLWYRFLGVIRPLLRKFNVEIEDPSVWAYTILYYPPDVEGTNAYYAVCELYVSKEGHGWTGSISPGGTSPKELIQDLEYMLKDVKKAARMGVRVVEPENGEEGYVDGL